MSFLAPWFLLGTLAVAGPVVFHLIRRAARERLPFGSLLFLRPTPPRATRRRKLEHILLLLLRCVALVLLAFAFARPFFPSGSAAPPSAEQGREIVILLDTSASMRRAGLWEKARTLTEKYLDRINAMDRVALMTFDQQPHSLISFSEWSSWPSNQRGALARRRLQTVTPSWGGTQLGTALITGAEQFPDETGRQATMARDVVLISDLQEGAKLDGLQGHDWPKDARVILERVDAPRGGNAGVEILGGDGRDARVGVVNSRDSEHEKLQLRWQGADAKTVEAYVPPGQMRTLAMTLAPTNAASGVLRLTGDDEEFDNTAYFAPPGVERVTVAYFGADALNDPSELRYYLQRAFPGTPQRQTEIATNGAADLTNAALAVIPSSLDDRAAATVRAWISGGKTALLVMTNTEAGATLAALLGAAGIEVKEASGDYALLGEIDFTHPIFTPFADPKYSDFSRIHFWKHRQWTPPQNLGTRILAKFDDGSPALTQIPTGKGNLLVLTAGWQPADSQLALSSKFVPLCQTILDFASPAPPTRAQFQIGEAIPCPATGTGDFSWRKPDGTISTLAVGQPFTDTDTPGIYGATGAGKTWNFAINLPADECRTAPLSPDDLARLGVPLGNRIDAPAAKSPAAERRVAEEELENRQQVWRWLIAALLAAAMAEIWLGGWIARRETAVEAAA